MKVSAINCFEYNNTLFQGKKNKETPAPVHTSSPLKAIPVAVLIAMSPLNTPVVNAQEPSTTIEYADSKSELVAQDFFHSNKANIGSCRVDVYKTKNGEKYVELHIAKKIDSYALDDKGNFVDAYRLKEVILNPVGISGNIETRNYSKSGQKVIAAYYVTGSGSEYTSEPKTLDPDAKLRKTQPMSRNFDNEKFEIPAEAYKHLKKVLKGQIDINEEHSSNFVIEGRRR